MKLTRNPATLDIVGLLAGTALSQGFSPTTISTLKIYGSSWRASAVAPGRPSDTNASIFSALKASTSAFAAAMLLGSEVARTFTPDPNTPKGPEASACIISADQCAAPSKYLICLASISPSNVSGNVPMSARYPLKAESFNIMRDCCSGLTTCRRGASFSSILSLASFSSSARSIASPAAFRASPASLFSLAISPCLASSKRLRMGLANQSPANSPATPSATNNADMFRARSIQESIVTSSIAPPHRNLAVVSFKRFFGSWCTIVRRRVVLTH